MIPEVDREFTKQLDVPVESFLVIKVIGFLQPNECVAGRICHTDSETDAQNPVLSFTWYLTEKKKTFELAILPGSYVAYAPHVPAGVAVSVTTKHLSTDYKTIPQLASW